MKHPVSKGRLPYLPIIQCEVAAAERAAAAAEEYMDKTKDKMRQPVKPKKSSAAAAKPHVEEKPTGGPSTSSRVVKSLLAWLAWCR